MNRRQCDALGSFASAIKELKEAGLIRSHRYLGDIAEFLCADAYNINLATNLREAGHDGVRDDLRVQIKYAGGEKTNVDFGDPTKYEEIYVVLGIGSRVRGHNHDADFLIYKMTAEEVMAIPRTGKGRYSRGIGHFRGAPDRTVSLSAFLE